MASNFQQTFSKLSLLGHNKASLLDCSEVIGTAPPATHKQAIFPPGKTHADIEQGVRLFLLNRVSTMLTSRVVRDSALPDHALDLDCPADQDSPCVRV